MTVSSAVRSFLAITILCALQPLRAEGQQQPTWFSQYLEADDASELSVCTAIVSYSNAMFIARLYGEDIDFIYSRDDFTLPYSEALGVVKFLIDGQTYLLAAFSFDKGKDDELPTAQRMQLIALKEDYATIFNALRFGTSFEIVFPNGDSYPTTLRGSDKALAAASNCWARSKTGPIENNPFGEGAAPNPDSSATNPFESL